MFTYPESRPLLNPIPFEIGHTVNPIPVLGAFGSMICLAWSHAAFQGGQGKCRWVGERDPSPQETSSALEASRVSCLLSLAGLE